MSGLGQIAAAGLITAAVLWAGRRVVPDADRLFSGAFTLSGSWKVAGASLFLANFLLLMLATLLSMLVRSAASDLVLRPALNLTVLALAIVAHLWLWYQVARRVPSGSRRLAMAGVGASLYVLLSALLLAQVLLAETAVGQPIGPQRLQLAGMTGAAAVAEVALIMLVPPASDLPRSEG